MQSILVLGCLPFLCDEEPVAGDLKVDMAVGTQGDDSVVTSACEILFSARLSPIVKS
jgi:hypothetical protein